MENLVEKIFSVYPKKKINICILDNSILYHHFISFIPKIPHQI